ncbi:MAG TPA: dihydrolipoamide acetyltransferase family protein [Ktedonobacteraceae bacterium]|nr:dihydrolipoamide acetyltransferase family protein [Ktedonobacteraceae bacterium]
MKRIEMPKMGDTMEEGKILRWIKKEGDPVKKGESLAEVETDKVNIEIEAFAGGVLRKILVTEGASAPVGATIAFIGTPDEPLPEDAGGRPGTVREQDGVGLPAPQAGSLSPRQDSRFIAPAGRGKEAWGASGADAVQFANGINTAHTGHTLASPASSQDRIFISPLARRIAQDNQLDYRQIRGTGPNGRIIKLDIEAVLTQGKQAVQPPTVAPEPELVAEPAPVAIDRDEVVEIPLTAMRRTIAKRLSQSMQTAPHFYVTSVIDTGKLAALRQEINAYAAREPTPVKVSFNDLIIKAVARALVHMPQVNVSFAEDRILQKKQVHIGVAVALDQGLIVPVLRNADQRGILDIARETQRLAEVARSGKLRPEEFSGGTFTVSNLGMFDVESFTAVINPPESAILAVGSIMPTPVVVDGQVVVRDRMKVTLSSDHRAIDGATAARFLQEVKRLLEEPLGVLL